MNKSRKRKLADDYHDSAAKVRRSSSQPHREPSGSEGQGEDSSSRRKVGAKLILSITEIRMQVRVDRKGRGNSFGEFSILNRSTEAFIFKIVTAGSKNLIVYPVQGIVLPGNYCKHVKVRSRDVGVPSPSDHKILVFSADTEGAVYDRKRLDDTKWEDCEEIPCVYYYQADSDLGSTSAAGTAEHDNSYQHIPPTEGPATEQSTYGSAPGAYPTPPPSPAFTFGMTPGLTRANNLYTEVQGRTVGGMSRPMKRKKLEEANRLYEEELQRYSAAHGPDVSSSSSTASILRNQGMTNVRLAEVVDAIDPVQEFQLVTYHLKQGVHCLSKALNLRPEEQNTEWGLSIQEKILHCIDIGLRRAGDRKFENQRVASHELDKVLEAIPHGDGFSPIRIKCHLAKSQYFYKRAVVALEGVDFRTTIQLLEYAREEKEMAANLAPTSKDVQLLQEIKIMEQDIRMHQCCCESVRVRSKADDLFDNQINEAENVDMRMMWTICDMYKEAVLLTREMDVENEAFALCRLGRMYDKVFKLRGKSHAYYREGFDLLQTLLPKNISSPWFAECKEALERFQKNVILDEQRREEAEKAPILEKLKEQLEQIKQVNSEGVPALLKFLYKTYPPKVNFEFKEDWVDERIRHKAILMKAVTHYHPDRQVNFGLEWRVLCGEITKVLTVRYEALGCIGEEFSA